MIGPEAALKKVGEMVTVQIQVRGGRSFKPRILLNSEVDSRSERNFTIVINQTALTGRYEKADYETFRDRMIRVKGTVMTFNNAPQIQVHDAKDGEILAQKAKR